MKYSVTSAEAAKLLKKLNEQKQMLFEEESQSCVFNASLNEDIESVRPEYDYENTRKALCACNEKIMQVKHAINCFNTSQVVGDTGLTIDQVLVRIPQLTEMSYRLKTMQGRLPKQRSSIGGIGSNTVIDYQYANYSVEKAKEDYVKVCDELRALQTALDIVNNTIKMEFELPD